MFKGTCRCDAKNGNSRGVGDSIQNTLYGRTWTLYRTTHNILDQLTQNVVYFKRNGEWLCDHVTRGKHFAEFGRIETFTGTY